MEYNVIIYDSSYITNSNIYCSYFLAIHIADYDYRDVFNLFFYNADTAFVA